MPTTSNDIGNQALMLVGDNMPKVSGLNPTWDDSTAGKALQQLYGPTVAAVQRMFGWDASRRIVTLTVSGNAGPYPLGFTGEFLYPSNGVEVWEIMPGTIADPYNPLPTTFLTGNTLVSSVQTKVIWTDVTAPVAIYNNNPTEAVWDASFTEAVVRLLASKLASAIAGKPETEAQQLQTGLGFEKAAEMRNA